MTTPIDLHPAVRPYMQIHAHAVRALAVLHGMDRPPTVLLDMAIELEHEAERVLKSARLAAQVRADLADKRRDDEPDDDDEPSAFRQWQQDVTA